MLRKKMIRGLFCWGIAVAIAIPCVQAADLVSNAPPPMAHAAQKVLIEHPGEKIDLFSGQLRLNHVDVDIPGNGGFNLQVIRTYSPRLPDLHEPMGLNWNIHFGRLKAGMVGTGVCSRMYTSTYSFETASGETHTFYRPNLNLAGITTGVTTVPAYLSMTMWRLDCIGSGDAGFVVTSPDGTRYELTTDRAASPTGQAYMYPSKITDKFGNYITLVYIRTPTGLPYPEPKYPLLSTVTASDGRKLTFAYSTDWLLNSITADDGRKWTYAYQREQKAPGTSPSKYFQLTSVTRTDGTAYAFQYQVPTKVYAATDAAGAGAGHLKSVTYPWGGNISYEYTYTTAPGDGGVYFMRVLSKKTTSDGGTWNFAYALSKKVGDIDTTTVTTADKSIVTQHFGYNSGDSSTCWKIGLPLNQSIAPLGGATLQTETNTWSPALISDKNPLFPLHSGASCGSVSQPQLSQQKLVRDGSTYTSAYSAFDIYGNPKTVVETGNGQARTTSRAYCTNSTNWALRQGGTEQISTPSLGSGTISRTYDSSCAFLLSESRFGVTNSFTWNADGSMKTMVNPRGFTTTYADYYRGVARQESQPEGVTISRSVSSAGCVLSETNGEGKTTSYSCDGLNRQTRIARPVGSATTIAWAAASRTATRDQLTEITSYDGFGRARQQEIGPVSGTRTVRSYTYDANGRLTFESNPWQGAASSAGKRYAYDALDRVKTESALDASGATLVTRTNSYLAGNAAQVTDERGMVTRYDYLSFGNPDSRYLTAITPPAGTNAALSLGRNFLGLVTSMTQGGLTRTYGYNTNFYLTSVTNPETGSTTYGRDAAGNMTSRAVGTSGTSTYTYDGQNRLTAVVYPGTTPSVANTYSKTHKLKSVVSSAAGRSYVYDANDNLTSESVVVDGYTLTTGYGYNALDQMASITYPYSGRSVTFSPDVLGRPTVVSGYVSSIAYWPSGQMKQINYANGTISTYGQNSRLWPSSFATQLGATYYNNGTYTYDGTGNLTAIADSADANYNRTLGYDAINRLTTVTGPWGNGTIAYNGVGNLVSQVLGSNSLYYTYDTQNRLSSVSGNRSGSYTYDAYGDIATAPGSAYTYDGVPNLRCVNCSTANEVANVYDGLNQRVSVTKGGVKTYEVYGSHGNLLAEYTPSQANKLVEYIHLGGKRVAQRETSQ
ncbi:MAG: hypothetical protein WBK19_20480 [Azonexus sp.]